MNVKESLELLQSDKKSKPVHLDIKAWETLNRLRAEYGINSRQLLAIAVRLLDEKLKEEEGVKV